MGFGDFAMGYLLGQSFSGPTYTGEIMGKPAGPDYDILNSDDPELVAVGEKAYWEAWDKACKEKVIERLRNHEEGLNFLTLQKQPIYPNMTQDEQADLLESGELKIVAPINGATGIGLIWTDENREEAKNPTYLELKKLLDGFLNEKTYRVVL